MNVSATGGNPAVIHTSGATMDVPPGAAVNLNNVLLGATYLPHASWFEVTATKTVGATTTPIALTGGSGTFNITANTTVTIRLAPLEEMFLTVPDLHYGVHAATILARDISLQDGFDTCTVGGVASDPDNTYITVFNGLADGWELQVYSEAVSVDIGGGVLCDVLASFMAVNGSSIFGAGEVIASSGLGPAGLLNMLNWANDLDYDGVVIEIPAGKTSLGDGVERQAMLTWTLTGGLPNS